MCGFEQAPLSHEGVLQAQADNKPTGGPSDASTCNEVPSHAALMLLWQRMLCCVVLALVRAGDVWQDDQ
jgi:hypothetical protein